MTDAPAAAKRPNDFSDRLAEAVTERDSALIVGLDPVLDRLPSALVADAAARHEDRREAAAAAFVAFHRRVIERVAGIALGVKPQIAFYERCGPAGLAAYEDAIAHARAHDLLVIGDVKRGDISSTASAYAEAHLGTDAHDPRRAAADAVTLNPYLGTDSIAPWIDVARRERAGLFVLVRTSNPSAVEVQEIEDEQGVPVYRRVAELVDRWGGDFVGEHGYSSVGAVVGATAPDALASLRATMPRAWFLVPGIGAQGGAVADVMPAFDDRGLGVVVNVSRSVLYAFGDPTRRDWDDPVADAARAVRDELRGAVAARS